jgi:ribosomal protein S18 acetylase RimI-like enzyme
MIRKATISDIAQLANLFDQYRVFYKFKSDLQGAKEFLTERLQNGDSTIIVDEREGNILSGFTQLYPLFSSTRMKKLWLLNDLYVSPEFRGKGISVSLINKAKELARETAAAGLMLETAKTNQIGNKLYPKTGFQLDSEHNVYSWDC